MKREHLLLLIIFIVLGILIILIGLILSKQRVGYGTTSLDQKAVQENLEKMNARAKFADNLPLDNFLDYSNYIDAHRELISIDNFDEGLDGWEIVGNGEWIDGEIHLYVETGPSNEKRFSALRKTINVSGNADSIDYDYRFEIDDKDRDRKEANSLVVYVDGQPQGTAFAIDYSDDGEFAELHKISADSLSQAKLYSPVDEDDVSVSYLVSFELTNKEFDHLVGSTGSDHVIIDNIGVYTEALYTE